MLKMLERFPIGANGREYGFGDFATLNVMQEAMRLAFADRGLWMGDPDTVPDLPVEGLIDDAYVRQRAGSCPDENPDDAFYCIRAGSRLSEIRPGDPRPFQAAGLATSSSRPLARAKGS